MAAECDLCGVTSGTEIEPGIFVCDGCGFAHVKTRRSAAQIAAAWSDVYKSGAYDPNWPGVKARLFYVAEWLDQKYGLAGKSVLDIGAGKGLFLDYASAKGALTAAIEPDAQNASEIRMKGHECVAGMVENVDLPAKFDLVTVLWTLENCGDCLGFLKHARKFMKDDGILVVATGSRILVPYKKPYSAYFGGLAPDLHCYRWTEATLARALFMSGFSPMESNDWRQNDVLLVASRPFGPDYGERFSDVPQVVVKFFRSWKETFP